MYTLYYSPGAASFAVHWMLIHIGAPFELVRVDLASKQQHSARYLALNPNGHVPTMIVDGSPAAECGALLMALSERHPEAGLSREIDDNDRMEYLQTMFYLANTLQPAFRNWFYPDEAAGAENRAATQAHARERIERAWMQFDARLQDGRTYLIGPRLSAADFLCTMLMRWSRDMPCSAGKFTNVAAYIKTMWLLPSLRLVHEREGLTDWLAN
jgi:glutathione S-transferase